jgi:hypothetical protein
MKDENKKIQQKEITKKAIITKENYDNLWNKIFITFLGLAFVGLYYLIRDIDKFRKRLISLNPSYDFPKISDFKICIPLFILISLFKYFCQKSLVGICEKIMKKNYRFPDNDKDRQLGEKYRLKLPEHVFKWTMYIILTAFGYYILKDLDYFPKSLLGKGSLPNMFIKGYPDSFYLEKPPLFDFYYMLSLSYFSSDLIWLLFINDKQTDFIMMLLHHICTISLIIFSHLVNYSNVGSIVLFLHVETDIFVHLSRFLIQTEVPEIIKDISGFPLVTNFLYVRIYVFGNIIYVLYKYITWKTTVDYFLLIFLTIIYSMHINWAILLVQKFTALFFGAKAHDTREYKIKDNNSKKISSKSY